MVSEVLSRETLSRFWATGEEVLHSKVRDRRQCSSQGSQEARKWKRRAWVLKYIRDGPPRPACLPRVAIFCCFLQVLISPQVTDSNFKTWTHRLWSGTYPNYSIYQIMFELFILHHIVDKLIRSDYLICMWSLIGVIAKFEKEKYCRHFKQANKADIL